MGLWSILSYILVPLSMAPLYRQHYIKVKELLPIVIAAAVWWLNWFNKSILCRCDNEAVVHIIDTGTSKDPQVMGLMRCLYFIAECFKLLLSAAHVSGVSNSLADTLSCNNLPFFLNTTCRPLALPMALLNLLVHSKPDWMSPSWSSLFNNTFSQAGSPTKREVGSIILCLGCE